MVSELSGTHKSMMWSIEGIPLDECEVYIQHYLHIAIDAIEEWLSSRQNFTDYVEPPSMIC